MAQLQPGPRGPRATNRKSLLIQCNDVKDPSRKQRLISTCEFLKITSMSDYVRDQIDLAFRSLPAKSRTAINKLVAEAEAADGA